MSKIVHMMIETNLSVKSETVPMGPLGDLMWKLPNDP